MTEEEIDRILFKLETLAKENALLQSRNAMLTKQASKHLYEDIEARKVRAQLRAAEAKVQEWFDYSQAWHPLIPKRRLKELKAEVPKPLETDIPF